MKSMLLIAGAVALGVAGPALAKPGNGHGNGHGNAYGHGNGQAYSVNGPVGYGVGGCPPGLAKKAVPCVPPGQAKKLAVGQRLPAGFANPYAYNQIPYNLRSQYGLNPNSNYYYNNGYLYGVDPAHDGRPAGDRRASSLIRGSDEMGGRPQARAAFSYVRGAC